MNKSMSIFHACCKSIKHYFDSCFCKILEKVTKVDEDRFFCISFFGNTYGDDLKPICDYIRQNHPNAKITWAFTSKVYNQYAKYEQHAVRFPSLACYISLYRSKYIISDSRFFDPTMAYRKRKAQVYMLTWHGTALKKIEKDIIEQQALLYLNRAINDGKNCDVMISNSDFMSTIYRKSFWFNGSIKKVGSPRNDIFFSSQTKYIQEVRQAFNIPDEAKIILYAPTFRQEGIDQSFAAYDIDLQRFKSAIEKKYGGKWVVVYRLHPNLSCHGEECIRRAKRLFPDFIDASYYPSMQQLLCATDILVSDYSSVMFDFMSTGRPCFIYTKDKVQYETVRGIYLDINALPFVHLDSNEDIENAINGIDVTVYRQQVEKFRKKIGYTEDGHAAENTYKVLTSIDNTMSIIHLDEIANLNTYLFGNKNNSIVSV